MSALKRLIDYLDAMQAHQDHGGHAPDAVHIFNEQELRRSDLRELVVRVERAKEQLSGQVYTGLEVHDMLWHAWAAGRDSILQDLLKPLGENGMRPSTPNPYGERP